MKDAILHDVLYLQNSIAFIANVLSRRISPQSLDKISPSPSKLEARSIWPKSSRETVSNGISIGVIQQRHFHPSSRCSIATVSGPRMFLANEAH